MCALHRLTCPVSAELLKARKAEKISGIYKGYKGCYCYCCWYRVVYNFKKKEKKLAQCQGFEN